MLVESAVFLGHVLFKPWYLLVGLHVCRSLFPPQHLYARSLILYNITGVGISQYEASTISPIAERSFIAWHRPT